MMGELTLTVPATCTAWYLVPAPGGWFEAEAAQRFALAQVDEYESAVSRRMVHDAVDASAVRFAVVTADDLTPGQRVPLRRVGPWISVRVTGPIGIIPVHESVARALVYPLAEEMACQRPTWWRNVKCRLMNCVRRCSRPSAQQFPEAIPRKILIPAEFGVHDDDVRAAYCLPGSYRSREWRWSLDGLTGPDQLVRLAFENGEHGILQVCPPHEWTGSAGDFLESLATGPMSYRKAATEPFVQEFQEFQEFQEGPVSGGGINPRGRRRFGPGLM